MAGRSTQFLGSSVLILSMWLSYRLLHMAVIGVNGVLEVSDLSNSPIPEYRRGEGSIKFVRFL
jgi:hypothetical protein